MKKYLMIASSILAVTSLGACKKQADAAKPAANQAVTMSSTSAMAAPAKAQTGTGEGKVISVNAATGAITIEHGPIKEINWPAMTMGFTAKSDLLKDIAVGEKVAFQIKGSGENYEVTSIHKR